MNLRADLLDITADLNIVLNKLGDASRLAAQMQADNLANTDANALVLKFSDHVSLRNYAERLLALKHTDGAHFCMVMRMALDELERLQKEKAKFHVALGDITNYITKEAGK